MPRELQYDAAIADELCERIIQGNSVNKLAGTNGFPAQSTIFKWLSRVPEFAEKYARARELQMESMAQEILEIAEEEPLATIAFGENGTKTCVDNAGIQRNRLRVDTRKWLMSKLAPKKYGDKIQHTDASGEGPAVFVVKSILDKE